MTMMFLCPLNSEAHVRITYTALSESSTWLDFAVLCEVRRKFHEKH